jgi:hypothetical protein
VRHGPKDRLRERRVRKADRHRDKDRHFAQAKAREHTSRAPVARRKDSVPAPRELRVPEDRHDRADHHHDFRNDRVAVVVEDRALRKLQWAASDRVRAFQRPNRASRFTRANPRRAVAVRQLKNDMPKASASCILCGLVRVRDRVRWLNRSRRFNASRGN